MASIASIQLTSGPNIQANLLEVSKYLEEISKGKSKLVVLPENFAFMPENDISFVKMLKLRDLGQSKNLFQRMLQNIKFGL